jgi:hypothetical protein
MIIILGRHGSVVSCASAASLRSRFLRDRSLSLRSFVRSRRFASPRLQSCWRGFSFWCINRC